MFNFLMNNYVHGLITHLVLKVTTFLIIFLLFVEINFCTFSSNTWSVPWDQVAFIKHAKVFHFPSPMTTQLSPSVRPNERWCFRGTRDCSCSLHGSSNSLIRLQRLLPCRNSWLMIRFVCEPSPLKGELKLHDRKRWFSEWGPQRCSRGPQRYTAGPLARRLSTSCIQGPCNC